MRQVRRLVEQLSEVPEQSHVNEAEQRYRWSLDHRPVAIGDGEQVPPDQPYRADRHPGVLKGGALLPGGRVPDSHHPVIVGDGEEVLPVHPYRAQRADVSPVALQDIAPLSGDRIPQQHHPVIAAAGEQVLPVHPHRTQ